MLFSYDWLQSFFQKKLPKPDKLAEFLTLHSFEVEGIEKTGQDWVLDIDITPNRAADCFSHFGIARECGALLKLKIKNEKLKINEDKHNDIKKLVQIEVRNAVDCPRYSGRVIVGVKVGDSPKWLQERLIACGLQPINNIVDAANYVMLELGQPLHALDYDKIEGKKIIIRRAEKGEEIDALDDKTYALDKDVLIIADAKKSLAIAGIKGGQSAAINKKTKNIFLESANFNPVLIRQTSRKLNLKTDASFRFEHGLDPNMAETAVNRLAELICKLAGGKIAQGLVDVYPKKVLAKKINLDLPYLKRLLGVEITEREAVKILSALELKTKKLSESRIQVLVPTWRPDLNQGEDLIEEVGRVYGYKNLVSEFPRLALIPPQRNEEIFWQNKIKDFLKGAGFFEVYNYSFISKKIGDLCKGDLVMLENPLSEEFYYLRPNLLINLNNNLENNLKYFNDKEKEIKIFELGKTFRNKNGAIEEKSILAGIMLAQPEGFYLLKGVVDSLLEALGISDKFYDDFQATPNESQAAFWNPAKAAEIKINGKEIGFLGELSSRVFSKKSDTKAVAFEIDFDKLVKFCDEEQEYQAISRFPSAVRDIAILVPLDVRVADVLSKIDVVGGDLVRDVDLFDIYEGEELEEGKKNLAFHIIYQAQNRTLTSQEIDKLQQKIMEALEEEGEWEVRR